MVASSGDCGNRILGWNFNEFLVIASWNSNKPIQNMRLILDRVYYAEGLEVPSRRDHLHPG